VRCGFFAFDDVMAVTTQANNEMTGGKVLIIP
jgi:hypothetical protein